MPALAAIYGVSVAATGNRTWKRRQSLACGNEGCVQTERCEVDRMCRRPGCIEYSSRRPSRLTSWREANQNCH